MKKQRICVFCGSKMGKDPRYQKAAEALGAVLGKEGRTLMFGGCDTGLMQAVSHAVHANGGKVMSMRIDGLLDAFDESIIAEDVILENVQMRKRSLIEKADACIALPGGFGTLDEMGDVLSMYQLGDVKRPLGLLNVNGFFDGLLHFADTMMKAGFLSEKDRQLLIVRQDIPSLLEALDALPVH